jgi:tyrosine-specific transport protein
MENDAKISNGSTIGAILLIAGCCIGAGMLGLPVLSAQAGYLPSIIMFIVAWLFMISTGLLVLEANLWFKDDVNVVTLADYTLGKVGKAIAWVVFLFLFYSLMVAYVIGSGELFTDFFEVFFSLSIPKWLGGLCMITIFGIMIYIGTFMVDKFNRFLMLGLILTYIFLVLMGNSHIKSTLLQHKDWSAAVFVLPAMIVSFGFHNLIPSVTHYLGRDGKRTKRAIILGSLLPLVIYLIWQRLILGIVPLEGQNSLEESWGEGQMATHALKSAVGANWITDVAQFFAFFAIVTSFLGVALSFVDFLSDGLKIPKKSWGKVFLCALALLPPYLFAIIYPGAFLTALNYAGGFGAVIIFGILPALMVWKGRYNMHKKGDVLLPGGKLSLIAVMCCSGIIILIQLYQSLYN